MGEHAEPPPRRWKLKAGFVVGFLVFAIAMSPLVWAIWAGHQLNLELARLRAVGEPVAAADLPVDAVPDDRNASLDYAAAGSLVDGSRPAWSQWDKAEPGTFRLPLTPDERATLRAIVADNGPALARVAAGRGKAIGSWHDRFAPPYLSAADQMRLGDARRAANLLRLAALSAHADGDDAAAAVDGLDLCRLSDAAEGRPTLIAHLVATSMWELAARTAGELAPDLKVDGPGGATRAQVGQWRDRLLDEAGAAAGRRLEWRTERIAVVETLRGLAAGQSWIPGPGAAVGGALPLHGYLSGAMALSDAQLACDALGESLAASAAPDLPAARLAIRGGVAAQLAARPGWHIFASMFLVSGERAIAADFRCTAARRLAAVALAARLYQLDHGGQLPATLAELAPAWLPAVPVDPMSGQPFLYRPEGADPKVYSVGENGVDNGGAERDPEKPYAVQKDRDDIVVHLARQPRAARPAEVGLPAMPDAPPATTRSVVP